MQSSEKIPSNALIVGFNSPPRCNSMPMWCNGSHGRLKICCLRACRFDSGHGYTYPNLEAYMRAFIFFLKAALFTAIVEGILFLFMSPDMRIFTFCMLTPAIFIIPLAWMSPQQDSSNSDYIRMQNFYNIDAMRRNSDREMRESWRKIK